MRLAGAATQGSGTTNEDGLGFIGAEGDVSAAWVFDGVTGINGRNYVDPASDAAWFVRHAHEALVDLAPQHISLPAIVQQLVQRLKAIWAEAAGKVQLPADYDPPAACLVLAKRQGRSWHVARLGDSCLMVDSGTQHHLFTESPNNAFDHWLVAESRRRGIKGRENMKALLAEFRPQLLEARAKRNRPGGYSILEASDASLAMPEYQQFDDPAALLLCTDGFFRAVDTYHLMPPEQLFSRCRETGGVEQVLAGVRTTEAADQDCTRFPRFKPADDATALCLVRD